MAKKSEEYESYARHCLEVARLVADREARIIQRQMAAEWLKLAFGNERTEQPAE